MVNDELVKLAQSVSADLVQAQALGEVGVVSTLRMAVDELLDRLAEESKGVVELAQALEGVSGP